VVVFDKVFDTQRTANCAIFVAQSHSFSTQLQSQAGFAGDDDAACQQFTENSRL